MQTTNVDFRSVENAKIVRGGSILSFRVTLSPDGGRIKSKPLFWSEMKQGKGDSQRRGQRVGVRSNRASMVSLVGSGADLLC